MMSRCYYQKSKPCTKTTIPKDTCSFILEFLSMSIYFEHPYISEEDGLVRKGINMCPAAPQLAYLMWMVHKVKRLGFVPTEKSKEFIFFL